MELTTENMIGQGNTAEIYQVEDGKIIKLFRKGMAKSIVELEYQNSKAVQEILDCVPKAYELIEVKDRFGIVYQKVSGVDMLKIMVSKIGKMKEFSRKFASYHLQIQKPVTGKMNTVKQKLAEDIKYVNILSEKEKKQILAYMQTLPDGDTLCHFDFHPGNIMLAGEKVYVLDWMTACYGDACADVMRTDILLNYGEAIYLSRLAKKIMKMFQHYIYKIYMQEYLKQTGTRMEDIRRWELPVAAARLREWISDSEKEKLLQLVRENSALLESKNP